MNKLISLCMIVKNEEKVLRRCLESVTDLVDEIIIVDTGSTDLTKEIARQYTEQIFDFEWINDFSAARNESIRRAAGEWILILDADEYVQSEGKQELKDFLSSIDTPYPLAIEVKIMNFTGESQHNSTGMFESSGVRLLKNKKGIFYKEPIHEQLTCDKEQIKMIKHPFILFHSGYTKEIFLEKDKSTRNMQIFENLKQNGKKMDAYHCFVLANEYYNIDKYKEALYYYKKSLSKSKKTNAWYVHCFDRIVKVLLVLSRYKEASDLIEEGIQNWNQHTDYYCYKGILLEHLGIDNQATIEFEKCLRIADESSKLDRPYWLIDTLSGRMTPYRKLAEISYKQKNIPQTVYYLTKILNHEPKSISHLYQLINLLTQTESVDSIIQLIEQIYPQSIAGNVMLLFQIFLTAGHLELTLHYHKKCSELNIIHDDAHLLRLALLTRDLSLFNKTMEQVSADTESDLSINKIIASLVWKQEPLIKHDLLDKETIYSICIDLFRLQFYDEFDLIINELADSNVNNLLADYFYAHNFLEIAMDFYSTLLNNEELSANGYKNLSMLYISQNMIEEGLEFLQKSIDMEPNISSFTIFLQYCHDPKTKNAYKSKFEDRYPEYKTLPSIRNL